MQNLPKRYNHDWNPSKRTYALRRKFCEDVLRHELRRYPDEVYRPDIAPAVSHSAMDLIKFVKNVERKTLRLEEETRRLELTASARAAQGGERVCSVAAGL